MDRRVTTVIPAWNPEPRLLRAAVDSALGQTHPGVQVIVVDDGSREPLDWLAQEYRGRITVIRKDNGGPASARNVGIRATDSAYIGFLDADDAWEPTKLARQIDALERNPGAGLCYTRVQLMDMDGKISGASPARGRFSGRVFDQLFRHNFVTNSSVVVTRRAIREVGEFYEGAELFAVEDYDLWLRIAERFELIFIDQPLARYRFSPAGISRDIARSYNNERNVVERALKRNRDTRPQVARAFRRRVAQIYRECADEYLQNNRVRDARSNYWASLRAWPVVPSTWVSFGVSVLGEGSVRLLRQLRSRWISR